ncbi:MAG: MerR family transcriptional regulator [Thermosulfidibacteraceae bacterium]|jgi:MerR family transcriptional regulator/heat shock protein HspR
MMKNRGLYPIGIVSRLLSVHPRMLRIYEREGLVNPVRIGGKRYYSYSDLQKLRCIRLLLEEGVNIKGVKRLFALVPCWRVINCPAKKREDCAHYREGLKMKIVFAVESYQGLNSLVSKHFRRSPYFVVVDLDEDGEIISCECVENPYTEIHAPGVVPGFILDLKPDVVIAGSMGQRAQMILESEGVDVVVGAKGTIFEVLQKLLRGEKFEAEPCVHNDGVEKNCNRRGER